MVVCSQISNDQPQNVQITAFRLSRLYVAGYTYTYIHVITANEKRGHEFESKEGYMGVGEKKGKGEI